MKHGTEIDYFNEAKALGYHPFIRFSPLEYQTIVEIHGRWAFDEILSRLESPANICRPWAVRFLGTAARLPREQLSEAKDLYPFVTKSEYFNDESRYTSQFWTVFYRIYRRIKTALVRMPPELQVIYREDRVRWRNRLMEQQHRLRGRHMKESPGPMDRHLKMMNVQPVIIYKKRGLPG